MNNARPICPGVPSLASGWSLELQACGVRKLTSEEAAMLHTVKEDLNYICGGPIFPSGHELETKIGVRSDLSCANEVASQYYACKRGFPTVCYHCVSKDPPPVSLDTRSRFQSVHPACTPCLQRGIRLRTRGEKKMKGK